MFDSILDSLKDIVKTMKKLSGYTRTVIQDSSTYQ